MNESVSNIGPLQKTTLRIQAGTAPDAWDLIDEEQSIDFVFGIGPEGFTPFEFDLAGKRVGDELRVHVHSPGAYFQHLSRSFVGRLNLPDSFYFLAEVIQIERAHEREVVRAMAEVAECGGNCDCGCGC